MKEKKKSSFAVLMHYAGGHKYYSYANVFSQGSVKGAG